MERAISFRPQMKVLSALLSVLFLSSCIHTAIAPVANPQGVPVVVRVPGVRAGQKATPAQIAAIDKKVEQTILGKSTPAKPDPAIIEAGALGFYGDVKTKQGERFVGYMPAVFIRSTYPPEAVDRAAGQAAAAYYRGAKKHYQLTPISDLQSQPKKPKP